MGRKRTTATRAVVAHETIRLLSSGSTDIHFGQNSEDVIVRLFGAIEFVDLKVLGRSVDTEFPLYV